MPWSKRQRITVMLGLDAAFFVVELIAGIAAHSLALQADAFHMLNDVISLAIGLWAVTVASKATTDKYSYGWLRAEILGAFFNAVFLIALCISIILEAVTRLIDPPEVKEPILILVVGCLGLCSNILGFVVLGGHGHSHGHGHGHGHNHNHSHSRGLSHGQEDDVKIKSITGYHALDQAPAVEEGRSGSAAVAVAYDGANDALPGITFTRASTEATEPGRDTVGLKGDSHSNRDRYSSKGDSHTAAERSRWPKQSTLRRSRLTSIEDMSIHPASFRQDIIAASREHDSVEEFGDESSESLNDVEQGPNEESPLLQSGNGQHSGLDGTTDHGAITTSGSPSDNPAAHLLHHRNETGKTGKSDHGHGDLGMNAMALHVLGDALGNIGVIATALVVWLSTSPFRHYADPAVSLFITAIILQTALPLTLATARILLQATPDHIDVPRIRLDIESIDGVVSCHHMHIWQLSDDKLVASMHIRVGFAISDRDGLRYMELARQVRMCLHCHGIHSATIQPEFCGNDSIDQFAAIPSLRLDGSGDVISPSYPASANQLERSTSNQGPGLESASSSRLPQQPVTPKDTAFSRQLPKDMCLLECVENCVSKGCCSSVGTAVSSRSASLSGRESHPPV